MNEMEIDRVDTFSEKLVQNRIMTCAKQIQKLVNESNGNVNKEKEPIPISFVLKQMFSLMQRYPFGITDMIAATEIQVAFSQVKDQGKNRLVGQYDNFSSILTLNRVPTVSMTSVFRVRIKEQDSQYIYLHDISDSTNNNVIPVVLTSILRSHSCISDSFPLINRVAVVSGCKIIEGTTTRIVSNYVILELTHNEFLSICGSLSDVASKICNQFLHLSMILEAFMIEDSCVDSSRNFSPGALNVDKLIVRILYIGKLKTENGRLKRKIIIEDLNKDLKSKVPSKIALLLFDDTALYYGLLLKISSIVLVTSVCFIYDSNSSDLQMHLILTTNSRFYYINSCSSEIKDNELDSLILQVESVSKVSGSSETQINGISNMEHVTVMIPAIYSRFICSLMEGHIIFLSSLIPFKSNSIFSHCLCYLVKEALVSSESTSGLYNVSLLSCLLTSPFFYKPSFLNELCFLSNVICPVVIKDIVSECSDVCNEDTYHTSCLSLVQEGICVSCNVKTTDIFKTPSAFYRLLLDDGFQVLQASVRPLCWQRIFNISGGFDKLVGIEILVYLTKSKQGLLRIDNVSNLGTNQQIKILLNELQ